MEELIGSGLNAGVGLASALMTHDYNKRMLEVARGQLKETQEMNKWQKDKYNQTLANQEGAIGTLGDAFKGAIAKEANANPQAPNQANQANQNQAGTPSAQNMQTQKEKEPELPTERM